MKRIITVIITILPIVIISGQTLAQNYIDETDQFNAQFYQEYKSEIPKDQEEKILKTFTPEMKSKMEEIKKLNKDKYQQLLRSAFPYGILSTGDFYQGELYGLKNASEKMKKEKELEIDAELLALKYKNADEGSQSKLRNELVSKLSELFEIKENFKQEEVKRLEKKLQDLKESLQARKQNKNEIVNRRIQELLGNSKYLRWE